MYSMAKGHDNLIPASQRSKDEARGNGQKGGIESGKSRRRKKALRTALKEAVSLTLKDLHPDLREGIMLAANIKDEELTIADAVIGGIIRTACGGNPQMVKILLDTIGERADIRLKERDVKLREKAAVLANGGSNKPKEQSTMVQLVQTLQKAREKRRTP